MLIIHGKLDVLAPVEAAIEHHRIVPQSEAEFLDDNHFMVFGKGAMLAPTILEFLDRVEQGKAVTRAIPRERGCGHDHSGIHPRM